MPWTGGTPEEAIPKVEHLVDIYNAVDQRLTATNLVWTGGDPGAPTEGRGWLDWLLYRDEIQRLATRFSNPLVRVPYTFSELTQNAWGTNGWRNGDMPHVPHLQYDLLDAKAVLDQMTSIWAPFHDPWIDGANTYEVFRYSGTTVMPDNFDVAWGVMLGASPTFILSPIRGGIENQAWGTFGVNRTCTIRAQVHATSLLSPIASTIQYRVRGFREITGAGNDFAIRMEGAHSIAPFIGSPPAMASFVTLPAAPADPFLVVGLTGTAYRYVRWRHIDWQAADNPLSDTGNAQELFHVYKGSGAGAGGPDDSGYVMGHLFNPF